MNAPTTVVICVTALVTRDCPEGHQYRTIGSHVLPVVTYGHQAVVTSPAQAAYDSVIAGFYPAGNVPTGQYEADRAMLVDAIAQASRAYDEAAYIASHEDDSWAEAAYLNDEDDDTDGLHPSFVDDRDPSERYGSPEHEAWLIMLEREER